MSVRKKAPNCKKLSINASLTSPLNPKLGEPCLSWLRLGFSSGHLINPYHEVSRGVRPCYGRMHLNFFQRREG